MESPMIQGFVHLPLCCTFRVPECHACMYNDGMRGLNHSNNYVIIHLEFIFVLK